MRKSSSRKANSRLTLGIIDNTICHIDDVSSGLKCGVHCAACGDRLVAKKGKRFHHFAHHRKENCHNGGETAIHLLSKEILAKELEMKTPRVELKIGGKAEPYVFYSEKRILFTQIKLETKIQDIIPDLIAYVCLLYTSPSPRDATLSRMPSSA